MPQELVMTVVSETEIVNCGPKTDSFLVTQTHKQRHKEQASSRLMLWMMQFCPGWVDFMRVWAAGIAQSTG
jgi:hypothetical protein